MIENYPIVTIGCLSCLFVLAVLLAIFAVMVRGAKPDPYEVEVSADDFVSMFDRYMERER